MNDGFLMESYCSTIGPRKGRVREGILAPKVTGPLKIFVISGASEISFEFCFGNPKVLWGIPPLPLVY
jgi:hypothetical protein